MKNITAVLWHGQYNLLSRVKKDVGDLFNFHLYSSKLLDEGVQDIDGLEKNIKGADAVLLYVASGDQIWEQIDMLVKNIKTPVIYIGAEGISRIKDAEMIRHSEICNRYMSYSGKDNMVQMMLYMASAILNLNIDYEDPLLLPWEGIYHPDTEKIFSNTHDYLEWRGKSNKGTVGLLVSRSYWINENDEPERKIIASFENRGYIVIPAYTYSMKSEELGAMGSGAAVEKFFIDENGSPIIDIMIKMTGFFLESVIRQESENKAQSTGLLKRLNCPVIKPIISSAMSIDEWRESEEGTISDIAWSIALPELEGVIEPIFLGGVKKQGDFEYRQTLDSRINKLVERSIKWISLKRKPNHEKRVVFVLNNNPCASVEATVGGGANLDTLESVAKIMQSLETEGYDFGNVPENGKSLISNIMEHKAISEFRWTTVKEIIDKGGALDQITGEEYAHWFDELPDDAKRKMIEAWGTGIGEEKDGVPVPMVYEDKLVITGVRYKNAIVCIQPKRGCAGAKCNGIVCKILHDPHVPPTHQYLATYRYFERKFGADVLIHMGTHGNLEFLPGKGTGLSDSCFPDICAGHLPCLYIYNSDNPPEGTMAKRRGLATIIDHMQTTLVQGGVYESLEELDVLLNKYDKVKITDPTQAHLLEHMLKEAIEGCKLDTQIDLDDYHNRMDEITEKAHELLTLIKNTQIQDGQHVFGDIPLGEKEVDYLNSILRYEGLDKASLRSAICELIGVELSVLMKEPQKFSGSYQKDNGSILFDINIISKNVIRVFLEDKNVDETINLLDYEIKDISKLDVINQHKNRTLGISKRLRDSKEIDALASGMNGDYIPAGPAGVITRGRDDVLPTGRNFFTLDPDTMPTRMAYEVGKRLGDSVVSKFMGDENRYPETFAMYWMCNDIMWADGEGMGQLMYLIGARPLWRSNGKVKGFEIIPIEELGRPRIDITVKVSGILRDNFPQCMELLDEAVQAVAALDEGQDINYVRRHTLENMSQGQSFSEASARIFGSKPGTYVSGVNLAVYASAWKEEKDFVDLFTYYNGYAYGKDKYGKEAYQNLQNGLKTVDITYNKVVSDEHDLLGCCSYFGNHGGMTAAARELSGNDVKTYYGDTREVSNVVVRTLADELRRVVRSKLLNPSWIEGQKRHGYKGAMDISKRIGRVYGWEATTQEVDNWIFDDITKTFIENKENKEFFMENNPWALEEISRRLIEAYERDLWQPDEGLIDEIKDSYLEIEGFMEDDMGDNAGDFQGGSIDIVDLNEIASFQNNIHGMKQNFKRDK